MINGAPQHVGECTAINVCVFYASGHEKVQLFHIVIPNQRQRTF